MSVRKAQTDFFSPMTGNVFRDNRRRADLIMDAAKVEMIKTDDPFTQVKEKRRYYSPDDPASITDAFDRDYGVLSDEEAAQILEENRQAIEEPTPVINPEPTPTPDPEPTANPILQIAQAALEQAQIKKSGREAHMGNSKFKMKNRVANREKAKAMAKARNAKKASSVKTKSHGDPGVSRAGRSGVGRGGARGGSTGGRGASSKGGVSRGSRSGSPSRGGARGGSTGGRGASSKGGVSRGGARTNRSRSRRRCDIRCKFDVSLLTNMNLVNDDLATLAYFVRNIKK